MDSPPENQRCAAIGHADVSLTRKKPEAPCHQRCTDMAASLADGSQLIMQSQHFAFRMTLPSKTTIQSAGNLRLPLRVVPLGGRTKIFSEFEPVLHGQPVHFSFQLPDTHAC